MLGSEAFGKLLSVVFTIQGISTVFVLVLALQFLKKLLFPTDLAWLPGPRDWPFPLCSIMCLVSVRRHGGLHNLEQYSYHKYGKLCRLLDLAGGYRVLVADPETVKQILVKEFHKFSDRGMPLKLMPPLDAELFLSKYPRWKRMRKVLSPTFSAARLKQVVPLISDACERLEAKVEKLADTGESVEVPKLFALFVLDVILSANFGVETKDIQTNTSEEFLHRAQRVFSRPLLGAFLGVFPFLAPIVGRFTDVLGNAGLFIKMSEEIIKQRRELASSGRRDVLQLMLEANAAQENGESKLSDAEISGASLSFLIAGFETTYRTLSAASYFLTTHPRIQEKLLQEIQNVKHSEEGISLYELSQSVKYLDWVLMETLRLVPIGYRLFRKCREACDINGVHFPKGVRVDIPAYAMHRDPEIWTDPERFDPERFSPEEEAKRHPFSYLPFGQGPRTCIGQRFAMLIMKIALVKILDKYEFARSPETKDTLLLVSTNLLQPRDPIYIKFKARG